MAKKKKIKPAWKTIRKFWTRNPVSRVKADTKKEDSKNACRKKPAKNS